MGRRRARSPADRENEVIALAYDLAERQLRDGTATAQVITHFLKLATEKDRLEREILSEQKKLVSAKTESIQSSKRIEELYSEAVASMQRYSGRGSENGLDDEMLFRAH